MKTKLEAKACSTYSKVYLTLGGVCVCACVCICSQIYLIFYYPILENTGVNIIPSFFASCICVSVISLQDILCLQSLLKSLVSP